MIATTIIIYLVSIFLMVRLIRYCNNKPEYTGWETEGHEGIALFITLIPFFNIIILIVIFLDVHPIHTSLGKSLRTKLAKLFNSKDRYK